MLRKQNVHGWPEAVTSFNLFCDIAYWIQLKTIKPVHFPPGSHPYTTNCYPMLFSHKVIDERGKKRTEADSIDHFVAPSVTAGANNIFIQSVKLCQKEICIALRQIWIHDQKMCAGKKIYNPKSARGEIITQKNRTNSMFVQKIGQNRISWKNRIK